MHWVVLCILVSILARCQCEWPETHRKFDVIFVIENETQFKNVIRDVATESYMGEYVHFGAIAFGAVVGTTIDLTDDKASFVSNVLGLNAVPGHGLDLALDRARLMMDAGGRDNADKVVICMLTGESDRPDDTALSAHNLRVAYIQIAAFGTGGDPALNAEMAEITSDPLRLMFLFDPVTVLNNMGIIFQVAGICSECRWDNSIHYVPDPANSNAFFQCNSVDNYIRKFCPLDLLWDKELVQCMPARKTLSKDDPCKYHPNLIHYGDVLERNCAYYWICSGGRTIGYDCCNKTLNETYELSGGHVHNTAPYATWPPVFSPPPYPVGNCAQLQPPCWDECPLVYPTFTPRITPTFMPCYPDIYLTFKPDVQGKGPNQAYIQNRGVRVEHPVSEAEDEYAGYFNGNSDLLSERHSHGWYGEYVEIFVRFMLDLRVDPVDRPEMLVSNGDYGEIHSIFIGFDRQIRPSGQVIGQVIVKFNTTAGYAEGTVDNVQGYWIEVRVLYDGLVHSLTADVTGFPGGGGLPVTYPQFSAVLSGNVRQTLPALHVGGYSDTSTREYNDLIGWVDKFWIYTCRPDPYFPGTEP